MAIRIHSLFVFVALCLLSLHNADAFRNFKWPKEPELVGFSWSNCGPATDPVQVKSIDEKPDPIRVPGNITVGASFALTKAGPTDIAVSVTMEKKVAGFYIKVPCIDNVGSCTYGDLCKDWADVCPKYFSKYGIPCACPIPANWFAVFLHICIWLWRHFSVELCQLN
jgi:hypothetical protein